MFIWKVWKESKTWVKTHVQILTKMIEHLIFVMFKVSRLDEWTMVSSHKGAMENHQWRRLGVHAQLTTEKVVKAPVNHIQLMV